MKKRNNITEDYEFFYGGYFSQWYPSNFTIDGMLFSTAEKWMMYNKAKFFNDTEIMEEILKLDDPMIIKALGRKVRNFDEKKWASVSYDIVVQGNIAKFTQNREMLKYLMQTFGLEIVEASPTDQIWGIGLSTTDPRRLDKSKWQGQNLLGKAIMEVREHFKEQNRW